MNDSFNFSPPQYAPVIVSHDGRLHQGDMIHYNVLPYDSRLECLKSLRSSSYECHKQAIQDQARNTGGWIIDDPLFKQWLSSSNSSILWVTGDPGCGKSVAAKFLIDKYLPMNTQATICYFFFRDGLQEQETLAGALSAILHQILCQQPQLIDLAIEKMQKGISLATSITVMCELFHQIVVDMRTAPIVCVFDALDECLESDRPQLIKTVSELSSISAARDENGVVKFLVTSRPYDDVERYFAQHKCQMILSRIYGEAANDVLAREIGGVIESDLSDIADDCGIENDHQVLLLHAITSMRSRTYLWWKFARAEIRRTYQDSLSPDHVAVHDIYTLLPASLEDAYENLLRRITTTRAVEVKLTFAIMLVARRPITLNEMARILQVLLSLRCSNNQVIAVDRRQLERQLRKWCGLFIFIRHSELFFVHTTAKQFLLRLIDQPDVQTADKWKHSLSLATSHRLLALACYGSRVERTKLGREYDDALLSYAQEYSAHHFAEAVVRRSAYAGVFLTAQLAGFGLDLKILDKDKKSILHHLIQSPNPDRHYSVIETVLKQGGLVQTADRRGMHCLHYAVRDCHPRVTRLLLHHGFKVDESIQRNQKVFDNKLMSNGIGLTALHAAALFGRPKTLSTLIKSGANTRAIDQDGRTALHLTVATTLPGVRRNDAWDEPELMAEHVWDYDDDDDDWADAQRQWALETRVQILITLCKTTPDLVNTKDFQAKTALHLVGYRGSDMLALYTVAVLLHFGANPQAQDENGIAPIHLAAKSGNQKCFKLLIEAAPLGHRIIDGDGRNGLHYAAMARCPAVLHFILNDLKEGYLLESVDNLGRTPLHHCFGNAAMCSKESVIVMLRAGAKANRCDNYGRDTLAHYLAKRRFVISADTIGVLLDHGTNANHWESGQNLAHMLVDGLNEVDVQALHTLRLYGTSVFAIDSKGCTIVHRAARAGTVTDSFLRYTSGHLLINAQDFSGKTALDYALEGSKQKVKHHQWRPNRWEDATACLKKFEARFRSTTSRRLKYATTFVGLTQQRMPRMLCSYTSIFLYDLCPYLFKVSDLSRCFCGCRKHRID